MDFAEIVNGILEFASEFARDNPIIALAVLLVFLLALYRKPVLVISTLLLALVLAGVLYTIIEMGGSGTKQKERLLNKTKGPDNILRLRI